MKLVDEALVDFKKNADGFPLNFRTLWSSVTTLMICVPNFTRNVHFGQRYLRVQLRIPGQDHNPQCGWWRRIAVDWCESVNPVVAAQDLFILRRGRLISSSFKIFDVIDHCQDGEQETSLLRFGFPPPPPPSALNLVWISYTVFILLVFRYSGIKTCTFLSKWVMSLFRIDM
jgi:hypothetical protein